MVTRHATTHHARVTRLHLEEGYGFLETPDGRELYFPRDRVLNAGFALLDIGTEVLVTEEHGEHTRWIQAVERPALGGRRDGSGDPQSAR